MHTVCGRRSEATTLCLDDAGDSQHRLERARGPHDGIGGESVDDSKNGISNTIEGLSLITSVEGRNVLLKILYVK